jgi:predicted ATP-grasp superfamily ATP-dependent carboligase
VHLTASDDVTAAARAIGLPLVVKPRRSWVVADGEPHRIGPAAAVDVDECRCAVAQMRALGSEVMLQEWVPGAREAVSFVYAYGTFHGEFAQVALRMVPILGGNSVARESVPLPPDAAAAARRLIAALGLEGYAEVEFRRDSNGVPVLMEINPRLSASVELAVRAGVDFPRLIYNWAIGERLDDCNVFRVGVRMRWLGGDIRWLMDTIRFRTRPDAMPIPNALWTFTRDFARPAGYDYWAGDDLLPAAIAVYGGVRSGAQLLAKRIRKKDG